MISDVPVDVRQSFVELTGADIKSFSFVGGGCINHGGKIVTANRSFFLKWNINDQFPGMLSAEAKGLGALREAQVIHIPDVIGHATTPKHQLIVLEYIEKAPLSQSFWTDLGQQLAGLHRKSAEKFGLDHDNYIGSLPQRNNKHDRWIDFFVHERINAQVKLAFNTKKITSKNVEQFEALTSKLPDILVEESPSLLHGDLWSGNLIPNSNGQPCLIDPAVYYGHREMEISFTKLFGGFDEQFYDVYNNNFPLEKGFRDRVDLYNLYPLMVHVNLFGGGYHSQVVSILNRFV